MTKKTHILVINSGSSSLKFSLYDMQTQCAIASGLAEALGEQNPTLSLTIHGLVARDQKSLNTVVQLKQTTESVSDHKLAINTLLALLHEHSALDTPLFGIGHRVVHGGESFKTSSIINQDVLAQIESCISLAPLHNPANLMGIKATKEAFPGIKQVAVFDTAFHQTIPDTAYLYPIPMSLYRELGIRRYGFHGTSHQYVTQQAAEILGLSLDQSQFISAHLGNGCSITAVKNGKSVDTSMGLTPLEGLMMGTRSGDIDPGIFEFLAHQGKSVEDVTAMLNKKSGLLGVSEISNDMRSLIDAAATGNKQALLAIDIFCFKLAKYVAAMSVSLSHINALIFTGGIGEHASLVRSKTVSHLSLLGFKIDKSKNEAHGKQSQSKISMANTPPILVIPTNEEWMIAKDTFEIING